jgi:hypothetical protein
VSQAAQAHIPKPNLAVFRSSGKDNMQHRRRACKCAGEQAEAARVRQWLQHKLQATFSAARAHRYWGTLRSARQMWRFNGADAAASCTATGS